MPCNVLEIGLMSKNTLSIVLKVFFSIASGNSSKCYEEGTRPQLNSGKDVLSGHIDGCKSRRHTSQFDRSQWSPVYHMVKTVASIF